MADERPRPFFEQDYGGRHGRVAIHVDAVSGDVALTVTDMGKLWPVGATVQFPTADAAHQAGGMLIRAAVRGRLRGRWDGGPEDSDERAGS